MAQWYDIFLVYSASLVHWHHFLMLLPAVLTISDHKSCFQERLLVSVSPWVVGVRGAKCDNSMPFLLQNIFYFLSWNSLPLSVIIIFFGTLLCEVRWYFISHFNNLYIHLTTITVVDPLWCCFSASTLRSLMSQSQSIILLAHGYNAFSSDG